MQCITDFDKMHSPKLSAALQNRLKAALCHWNYTYGNLLFIQVCSGSAPMHCKTGFGKMQSPQLSAALQQRLTVALCLCNYTYEDLLLIQVCNDPPPMHCKTGFGKMQSPLLSAALQPRLTAALCQCNYTCGNLLFIQVCSGSAPMHCKTDFGNLQSPLLSAALQNSQNRLTVALCLCNYTYGNLLFIQVCSGPPPMQCITDFDKMHSPKLLQQACSTAHTHTKICSPYRCAVTQHQNTAILFPAKCSAQCCSARQACSRLVSLHLHL